MTEKIDIDDLIERLQLVYDVLMKGTNACPKWDRLVGASSVLTATVVIDDLRNELMMLRNREANLTKRDKVLRDAIRDAIDEWIGD